MQIIINMKLRIIFFFVIFITILSNVQITGHLSCWGLDKNTQKPISGVIVKLVNPNLVAETDAMGKNIFKS